MIRFIDLRGQITDIEECPVEFTFFDTTTDTFVTIGGCTTWRSRQEFFGDAYVERFTDERMARFAKLLPEWVP